MKNSADSQQTLWQKVKKNAPLIATVYAIAAVASCTPCLMQGLFHRSGVVKKADPPLPGAKKTEERKKGEGLAAVRPERVQEMLQALQEAKRQDNKLPTSPVGQALPGGFEELDHHYHLKMANFLSEGKYVEAQEIAEVYVLYRGEEPLKYIGLGDALAGQRKNNEASEAYHKALQLLLDREKNLVKINYNNDLPLVRRMLSELHAKIEVLKK